MNNGPVTEEPLPGKRAGRVMLIIAWAGGLYLATHLFGLWEEHRENPNDQVSSRRVTEKSGEVVEVTLLANRQGHFVASGQINQQPVKFFLDTGSTDVAVPESLAGQLGLQPGDPITLSTANGHIDAYRTRLDELRLGEISLHNVRAVIDPGLDDQEVLLGMSALRQLDFSQRGGTLLLRQTLNQTNQ